MLLIERGPVVDSWISRVPLLSVDVRSSRSPTYQWKSTPNISSDDIIPANMVSGKALGGTSKVNANVYTRSVPGEYNAWEENGRRGWSWKDVLPYFTRSENSSTNRSASHKGSHGTDGIHQYYGPYLTLSPGPWHNRHLTELHFKHSVE